MSVRVKLPPALQELSGGRETLETSGRTIDECLKALEARFPGIRETLLDRQGKLLHAFGIYINSDGLRPVELYSQVRDGEEIVILNFIMGG